MAIRERLHPTAAQQDPLRSSCAHARFVWNLALEQRNFWRAGRGQPLPALSGYDQKRQLAEARACNAWLRSGSSVVQQQAVLDLDQAFKNWWGNPGHFGRPTWRKAGIHEGFYVRDNKTRRLNRKWGEVLIPKVGYVKFRITRSLSDIQKAKSARVTMTRMGDWYISFTLPQPEVTKELTGATVGIDLGVASTMTTSEGLHSSPGRLSPKQQERLLRLQRKLARQKKGSKRREATRKAIAKLRAKEAAKRKDWVEKVTTQLVRDNDLIGIEDLKVSSMMRSASGTLEKPGTGVSAKRA